MEAFAEFPKWKYHPAKGGKIVQNPEEEAALGANWYESPADFPKPDEIQPEAASEPAPAKSAKPKRQKKQDGE
jgi:hypothetical protein